MSAELKKFYDRQLEKILFDGKSFNIPAGFGYAAIGKVLELDNDRAFIEVCVCTATEAVIKTKWVPVSDIKYEPVLIVAVIIRVYFALKDMFKKVGE